jgi:uncharacterized metal-binding protein
LLRRLQCRAVVQPGGGGTHPGGFGKLSCLAGVGAHLSGFVQSARDITELAVIDGCEVGCAKGVLEQAEVPLRAYLVITGLGIDKNKLCGPTSCLRQ